MAFAWFCAGLAVASVPAEASPYSDFNAGIALRNSGECREAIARFSSALAVPGLLDDLRPVAFHARGACHAELNEYPAALDDFGDSLKLDPNDYDTLADRASVLIELKRYDEAEADLRKLQNIRPDLTPGYAMLGAMYEALGKYHQAIEQFSVPIDNETNPAAGYALRAHAYLSYGRTRDALDDAEDLVKLKPDSRAALRLRAWVYELRGDYDDAMRDFDALIRGTPSSPDLWRSKALLYWKMKRYDDAAGILATLDPSDGYNVLWLAIVRAAGGKLSSEPAPQKIDPKKWPGPLNVLYQGHGTPESVRAAITADGPDYSERDECEGAFYVGEWHLMHNEVALARPLLKKAATTCVVDYVERSAAEVQLEQIE